MATVVVGFFTRVALGVALLLLLVVVVSGGGGRRNSDDDRHRLIRDDNDDADGDEDFNALYSGGIRQSRSNPGELASIMAYLRDTSSSSSAYQEDEHPPQRPPYMHNTLRLMGKRAPTACINNCLDRAVSFVRCRSICH